MALRVTGNFLQPNSPSPSSWRTLYLGDRVNGFRLLAISRWRPHWSARRGQCLASLSDQWFPALSAHDCHLSGNMAVAGTARFCEFPIWVGITATRHGAATSNSGHAQLRVLWASGSSGKCAVIFPRFAGLSVGEPSSPGILVFVAWVGLDPFIREESSPHEGHWKASGIPSRALAMLRHRRRSSSSTFSARPVLVPPIREAFYRSWSIVTS